MKYDEFTHVWDRKRGTEKIELGRVEHAEVVPIEEGYVGLLIASPDGAQLSKMQVVMSPEYAIKLGELLIAAGGMAASAQRKAAN